MDLQLKYVAATQKSVNAATRTIEAIVSDETIDSYGDIIDSASWKLQRYQNNPVVLFQHQRDEPIGFTKKIWLEKSKLHAIMVLSETERGRKVMQLFAEGALRAFSVGFGVGRIKEEFVAGRKVMRLFDCDLHEISAVSIPANPNAVVKHKSLGLVPPSYSAIPRSGDAVLRDVRKGMGIDEGPPGESAFERVMRSVKKQREGEAENGLE